MDLVVGGELAVLGQGGSRVSLGVLGDQLDLPSGRLVVGLVEGELEPVQHLFARLGEDPRERAEIADLDRLRRARRSPRAAEQRDHDGDGEDRKSTRLNSSHLGISYAVFCLKKKKKI